MLNLNSIRDLLWYLIEDKQVPSQLLLEESDRLGLFQAVYESFNLAQQKVGAVERFYNIGSHIICLRFAGQGLIPYITKAIAHLETKAIPNPSLTICLWDSVSTQTKMSALVDLLIHLIEAKWGEFLEPRKEIKGWHSDRVHALFHIGPNILSLLDKQRNLAVYWLEDAVNIPYFEHGSPLQTILNWWVSDRNCQYVHAGAIGTAEGGVLIAGKGGSGKSTASLASINSPLSYVSDDYCLVSVEPNPYVYSLYNTAKLRGIEDIQRFPHLANLMGNLDNLETEKAMIFLYDHYPEKVTQGFPIQAILVPQITGQPQTTIERTSAAIALKALAPSTLFQLSGTGQKNLQFLSQLVKQVPCYILKSGTNLEQIPEVIYNLLKQK